MMHGECASCLTFGSVPVNWPLPSSSSRRIRSAATSPPPETGRGQVERPAGARAQVATHPELWFIRARASGWRTRTSCHPSTRHPTPVGPPTSSGKTPTGGVATRPLPLLCAGRRGIGRGQTRGVTTRPSLSAQFSGVDHLCKPCNLLDCPPPPPVA